MEPDTEDLVIKRTNAKQYANDLEKKEKTQGLIAQAI